MKINYACTLIESILCVFYYFLELFTDCEGGAQFSSIFTNVLKQSWFIQIVFIYKQHIIKINVSFLASDIIVQCGCDDYSGALISFSLFLSPLIILIFAFIYFMLLCVLKSIDSFPQQIEKQNGRKSNLYRNAAKTGMKFDQNKLKNFPFSIDNFGVSSVSDLFFRYRKTSNPRKC